MKPGFFHRVLRRPWATALLVAGLWPALAAQADDSLPVPWDGMDIGSASTVGSSLADGPTFTVRAGGGGLGGASDQFHYVYQSVTGDFSLVARVTSETGLDDAAKAGLMIRDALATTSSFVAIVRTLRAGVLEQYRTPCFPTTGVEATSAPSANWLRLVKRGTRVTGYIATDVNGSPGPWKKVGGDEPTATGLVYVGLCVTGHAPGAPGAAVFSHVALSTGPQPALDNGTYAIVPASAPALTLTAKGAGVGLAAQSNQAWVFTDKGGGEYDIQPSSDHSLALAVAGGGAVSGTKIVLQADQGLPSERWVVVPNANGTYGLVPKCASGSGLDDFGGNATSDAVVDLWDRWAGDPHTQWTITPAEAP